MLINQSIIAFLPQLLKWFLYPTYSDDFYFLFIEKKEKYSLLIQFPLCHLTSCVPSKSGTCFDNSLPAIFCDSSGSKLKISGLFIVAYVLPSNIIPRTCQPLLTCLKFFAKECMPSLSYRAGRPPLVRSCEYLFKIFTATFRIWRPFSASTTWGCATPFLRGLTFQLPCKFSRLQHNFFVFKNCITSHIYAFFL